MKRIGIVLAAAGCMVAYSAQAQEQDRDLAEIFMECGLGGMIAPEMPAVAVITNVIWDLGTTATTSALSSEETCKGGQGEQAAFIMDTYPNLEKDLAVGNGVHLTTLLGMAGYDAEMQPEAAAALRTEFTKLVADADYSTRTRYENAEKLFVIFQAQVETDALNA